MIRQSQRAGDNSTQVSTTGDVTVGITEERAREIATCTAQETIEKYADEGFRTIQERITKLDDRVLATLIREGRLEVFADPAFQRSYKQAQEGAAVSGEESDYDLLTGLLADRASRGDERKVRAGIEQSIKIVDQVDSEALRGLTVFQAVHQYVPLSPRLGDGLDAMDSLFNDLLDGPLPEGDEWLDHLDILGAIRFNHGFPLKPFRDYYPTQMRGYVAPGSPSIGANFVFTLEGQTFNSRTLVMDHELRPGYKRFAVADIESLKSDEVSDAALEEISAQAKESLGYGEVCEELVDPFLKELRLRPALSKIEEWWDQIPNYLQTTAVGRVLARANARRLDVRGVLPPID